MQNQQGIVIAESVARKVFGDTDPIGQQFDPVNERGSVMVVTGILKDMPANIHFHAKFITRIENTWPEIIENKWLPALVFNYILLDDNTPPADVASKVNAMLKRVAADVPDIRGANINLQPLTSIHLQSHYEDEFEANGNIMLVVLLLGIGAIIMIMSWINYINIETARFLRRAREVGVRRVIGSARRDLALQFLVEFFCITMIAVVVGCAMIALSSSAFLSITAIPVDLYAVMNWEFAWVACVFYVIGTFFTGIYPAMYIIRLKPAHALKGSFNPSKRRGFVRKPLLVIQFSASMILIALLLVINGQLDFMRIANKKIDVDRVIAVNNPVAYAEQEVVDKYSNYTRLRDKLTQQPAIDRVETSSAIPGTEIGFTYVNLIKRTVNDPFDPTRYKVMFVGENFLSIYGIRLLAGRNFEMEQDGTWKDPWQRRDWSKIVINEKAAKQLGFKSPQDAVNQVVKFQVFDEFEDHEIIGVMEDYHHEAVRKATNPMVLKPNFNSYQQVYYSIRLRAGVNPQEVLSDIERSWRQVFPEYPFEYFFVDNYYDQQFKSEQLFSAVFSFFAGIAIFIGCLGVLGMALFESSSRIKEISIRKVLGASAGSLLALLSRDQLKCLIISCAVALPLTWYAADSWLATYPTQVGLSLSVIVVPVMIIAFTVTIISCLQALRAAAINPVEHLKNE